MEENELLKLKYPIGKFVPPVSPTHIDLLNLIKQIELLPSRLKSEVEYLNDSQLDTPYRENGWTIRQVVHHLADSHMNAYIRFKLAITENSPVINAYKESLWAEMKDARYLPIGISLTLLDSLHTRWIVFLNSVNEADLHKGYFHPEKQKNIPLTEAIGSYAWHCNHHLAHITSLKSRMKW